MNSRRFSFASLAMFAIAPWIISPAAGAAPIVLDFEALRHNDNDIPTHGTSYAEDGYLLRITTPRVGWATVGVQHSGFKGSTAIFPNDWRADAVLTRIGGGTFDVLSVDLIEHIEQITPTVTFVGLPQSGGTVSITFRLDGNAALFETFTFPDTFTSLTQVTWSHIDSQNSFRLDNITLDLPAPPAVPLPPAVFAGMGAVPLLVRARRALARQR